MTAMSPAELERFLTDLLSPAELASVSERWAIVKCLAAGMTQREVRDALSVSVTTVTRGNKQLKQGSGGFALALARLADQRKRKRDSNA